MEISENTQNVNEQSTSGIGHNGGPELYDDADTLLNKKDGYVRAYRSLRTHPIVGFGIDGPYSKAEAWLDLLMECRYAEATVNNNGRPMKLKRGQLLGAVSWLAERWSWTPKEVRYFLDKLEAAKMIKQEQPEAENGKSDEKNENQRVKKLGKLKGRYAKFISVSKYSIYQAYLNDKGQVEGQEIGNSGAGFGNQRGNSNNKGIREDSNKGIQEQNISQPATVEQDAVREALAGSHDPLGKMLNDITSWMNGGSINEAREWLRNTQTAFGNQIAADAYQKLKTDMATGKLFAQPLQAWSSIAKRLRDEAPKKQAKTVVTTAKPWMQRY